MTQCFAVIAYYALYLYEINRSVAQSLCQISSLYMPTPARACNEQENR